jgi:hypothetical protein
VIALGETGNHDALGLRISSLTFGASFSFTDLTEYARVDRGWRSFLPSWPVENSVAVAVASSTQRVH